MQEREVPAVKTPVTLAAYLAAVKAAWPSVEREPYVHEAGSVLYGQYWIETGGKACWCWNIGNVKHFDRDGFDYYCIRGVWEGVTRAEAQRLIARGEATLDPSLSHNTAVGDGKVSVIFNPPHPQTRFRAYASLEDAMSEHLRLLKKRFSTAWSHVMRGDVLNFAYALKARGYFTADPSVYAAGVQAGFERAVAFEASLPVAELDGAYLQLALQRLGYSPGPADGVIGPRTLDAVRRFQLDRGLTPDAVVGPITKAALANAVCNL